MNIKQIKSLADIMNSAGLTNIEITEGDTVIKLEKKAEVIKTAPVQTYTAVPAEVSEQIPSAAPAAEAVSGNVKTVSSPMPGVFYAAPSPDDDPYVRVGTKVKKGDVVCIIEAMKLMNEIVAEHDGEIAEICVSNEEIVEYGQVLFKIR